ncbi:MAG: hypothetical protein QMC85_02195 [Methanocellales archaeon]|nr:hypothetical protein [Methanocellales archaeon]
MTPEKTSKNLEEFRKKVREVREKEWIREAVRARKFTGAETFQQGLDLIRFALELHEAGKHAEHG